MFYTMFVIGSSAGNLKIDQLCVFWTQASKYMQAFPTPLRHMQVVSHKPEVQPLEFVWLA